MLNLDEQIGAMGTIMVVAGLAGSLIGGILLDKFKKYKLTTLVTYIFSLAFMALFTYMVDFENLQLDFFFIGALGECPALYRSFKMCFRFFHDWLLANWFRIWRRDHIPRVRGIVLRTFKLCGSSFWPASYWGL